VSELSRLSSELEAARAKAAEALQEKGAARLCIFRSLFKSLLNFKDRIETPVEF
jgi:hypothetical protein